MFAKLKSRFKTGDQKKLTKALAAVTAILVFGALLKYASTQNAENLLFVIGVLATGWLLEHVDHLNDVTEFLADQFATNQPPAAQPATQTPAAQPATTTPAARATTTPPTTSRPPAAQQQGRGIFRGRGNS
jgi:hypothetical protein